MPDRSPHELLTAAADRLDTLLAEATPGPWTNLGPDSLAPWTVYDRQWSIASTTVYDHNEPLSNKPGATGPAYINADANAAYIAAMNPLVGRYIATWLREAAIDAGGYASDRVPDFFPDELAVARAILAAKEAVGG